MSPKTLGVPALAQRDRAAGVLTPLELQIMQVLWDKGAATVAEAQERLGSDLAYTTVQTMLNVLLRKKKVRRELAGRAFVYRPAVSQEKAMGTALDDLVARMFGGSGEALLMALIDTRKITPEALARASRLLEEREE
jgi:BlaI family transcriptional regulator, penicillinase repressor